MRPESRCRSIPVVASNHKVKAMLLGVAFLAISTDARPVLAGAFLEIETRAVGSEVGTKTHVFVDEHMARFDIELRGEAGPRSSMIYRGDLGEVFMVDHDRQQVMQMDQGTIRRMAEQHGQMMKNLEKSMANVPEDVRKMMESRMPAAPPEAPKTEIKKTNEKKTVAKMKCVRYDVFEDGEKVREHWVATHGSYDLTPKDFAVFEEIGDFFASLSSMSQGTGGGVAPRNPMEEMGKLDGIPVSSRRFEGGKPIEETVLLLAEKRSYKKTDFEAPAAYEVKSMGPTGKR